MLKWIITFFILAIVTGVLGFGGIAWGFMEISKILAVIFVILFVMSAIYKIIRSKG